MKILHLITSLNRGGAEFFLYRLLSRIDRSNFDPTVISLQPPGAIGEKIRDLDIPVSSLEMSRSWPDPRSLFDLARRIDDFQPDLLQTWMYHADLMGGIVGQYFREFPILWSIRQSTIEPGTTRLRTLFIIQLCSILSSELPDRIVANSHAGRQAHLGLGYRRDNFTVVPNGYDTDQFRPKHEARQQIRDELNIKDSTPLIGLVARYHPQKDHRTFLEAAAQLRNSTPEVHFLLCGKGIHWSNEELVGWIREFNLSQHMHLLGKRDDMPTIQASLDVATSSSAFAEGNPNVIGEAMACEVPCVVTDIGDSSWLVGDTGITVPPKSPQALAEGWNKLLSMSDQRRHELGKKARERIRQHFKLDTIVGRYQSLYRKLSEV